MLVYKGTDKDMRCRGLQYEIGKPVEANGDISMCNNDNGLHACEMPLDVLNYYPPCRSRYFVGVLDGVSDERSYDSKRVGRKLELKTELNIASLIKAQINYVRERATTEGETATGFRGAASAAGNQGAASATGLMGAASATGNCGVASAAGNCGVASATGLMGAASATGFRGAASATGFRGAASAAGNRGAASATGDHGVASATGDQGAASAAGDCGTASATGDCGAASATGDCGAASATGNCGAASATGNFGAASAAGNCGAASATGDHGAASVTGKTSVAVSTGVGGRVMGALGCAIVCVERGDWDGETRPIKSILAAVVDGDKIKPGIWYTVKDGQWVEIGVL